MMRVIRRYTISIDDRVHEYKLCEDPLYAAQSDMRDQLWFWAEYEEGAESFPVRLQVLRDGEAMPDRSMWLATVLLGIAGGRGAVHLIELPSP